MADQQGYQDDGEPSEVSIGDGEGHHEEAVGEVRLEQDGGELAVAGGGGGRDDDNYDDERDDHLGARLQKRKRGRKTTLSREARRARWRGRWGMWQERNLCKEIMMRTKTFRLMLMVRSRTRWK